MPPSKPHPFLEDQTIADRTLRQHQAAILVIMNQLENLSKDDKTKNYRKFHPLVYYLMLLKSA